MKLNHYLLRSLLCEFLGTGLLSLTALLTGDPLAVGLALTTCVYAFGSISGAHVNPAITVGVVALQKMSPLTGSLYIMAQFAGAVTALFVTNLAQLKTTTAGEPSALLEVIGVSFLFLVVAAVVNKQVTTSASGIAVGSALVAGLLTSKGILNPAVATAFQHPVISPSIWAPVLGTLLLALIIGVLNNRDTD